LIRFKTNKGGKSGLAKVRAALGDGRKIEEGFEKELVQE